MKKKAFTLIELIAVLVILAILALIVMPLVMSIIKKARISADKRSVDAYGRSVELAIATYLLDEGKFPASIDDLSIEYTGDEVVCTTTQLNSDSSVYLAGCHVAGRSVEGYTYGKEEASPTYTAYEVGNQVSYNNINYYVIKDSDTSEEYVTLLKSEPLSVAEVNQYGAGHVNRYAPVSSVGTAYNMNGYGGMAYYTSASCGYNDNWIVRGCINDYAQSEVKYAVDSWASAQAPAALEARLITLEDLQSLDYCDESCIQSGYCSKSVEAPSWLHNDSYWYWTSSPRSDLTSDVWYVSIGGGLGTFPVNGYYGDGVVRPVITLSKTNLSS